MAVLIEDVGVATSVDQDSKDLMLLYKDGDYDSICGAVVRCSWVFR